MTDGLTPRAEALLEELIVGDCAADDPRVVELAARDPHFREALDEHLKLGAWLDATGKDEADALNAARDLDAAPGEAGMTELLLGSASDRSANRWIVPGLAAAAAILFLVWPYLRREPAPLFLGDGVQITSPCGTDVQGPATVEWTGSLPPGGRYRVSLREIAGAGALLAEHETEATRWKLDSEQRALFERPIAVRVDSLTASGEVAESASCVYEP